MNIIDAITPTVAGTPKLNSIDENLATSNIIVWAITNKKVEIKYSAIILTLINLKKLE